MHADRQLQGEEEVSRPPGIFSFLHLQSDPLPQFIFVWQHLVDAGLMRDDELKVLQDLDTKVFVKIIDVYN